MKTANVDENARTLLGEDYPAILEMMENLSGLPHSHTPPLTPITPSDFLPVREKIFYYFSPGL